MAMFTHLKYSGSIDSHSSSNGYVNRVFRIKKNKHGIRCGICGKEIEDESEIYVCLVGKLLFHYKCDQKPNACEIQLKNRSLFHQHTYCEKMVIEK